jgi:hypothetical protein
MGRWIAGFVTEHLFHVLKSFKQIRFQGESERERKKYICECILSSKLKWIYFEDSFNCAFMYNSILTFEWTDLPTSSRGTSSCQSFRPYQVKEPENFFIETSLENIWVLHST